MTPLKELAGELLKAYPELEPRRLSVPKRGFGFNYSLCGLKQSEALCLASLQPRGIFAPEPKGAFITFTPGAEALMELLKQNIPEPAQVCTNVKEEVIFSPLYFVYFELLNAPPHDPAALTHETQAPCAWELLKLFDNPTQAPQAAKAALNAKNPPLQTAALSICSHLIASGNPQPQKL